MASRLFGGSKPSKSSKVKSPDLNERSSALPKRSAIPTPPAPISTSQALKPSLLPKTPGKSLSGKAPAHSQLPTGRSTALRTPSSARTASNASNAGKSSSIPTQLPAVSIAANIAPAAPAPRARLRRKASVPDQRSQYARSETSESSREQNAPAQANQPSWSMADPHPGTLLGIPMPPPVCEAPLYPATTAIVHPTEATSNSRMNLYNARQQLPKLSTPDPPFVAGGSASTPSTRFSGSPGNFSRGSTPTSASSHSPSLIQNPKFGSRGRPSNSPANNSRPPVVRRKAGSIPRNEEATEDAGLPAVRESNTSSSASSPTKPLEGPEQKQRIQQPTAKKSRMPPPTPPLRLSSKRGKNSRSIISGASTEIQIATSSFTSQEMVHSPESISSPANTRPLARPSPAEPSLVLTAANSAPPARSMMSKTSPQIRDHSRRDISVEHSAIPPPRPSRDGLPSLEPVTSPVVQSNMTQVGSDGRSRRESSSRIATPSTAPPSKTASARTSHSRSTSVTSQTSQTGLTATASGLSEYSPHLYPRNESKTYPPTSMRREFQSSSSRDPSASPSRSPGRFGFLSRKLKSPSETSVASPPPAKLHKKGPAAGTGHEGYSRYARRGRSTSIGATRSRNTSTSTDRASIAPPRPSGSRKSSFNSTDGTPELDDFYRDRLEPITISGGGAVRENRNSKTSLYQSASGQSSVGSFENNHHAREFARQDTPSVDHGSLASSQNPSRELLPAPRLVSTPQGIVQQERTIAYRRSLHRSQQFADHNARVPPPINTKATTLSPAIDTYDSTLSSVPPTEASVMSDVSEGHEGNWLRSKKAAGKGKNSRRWNIFRRNTKSPERIPQPPKESFESERAMTAQVTAAYGYGPVAHYAMMDENESTSDQELEDKLRVIESNLEIDMDNGLHSEVELDRQPSMLLPPPPLFPSYYEDNNRPVSPRVPLKQSPVREQSESPRQPRLQQVGRIPRVISNRDREQMPILQSFSRPFPNRPTFDEDYEPHTALGRPILDLRTHDLVPRDQLAYNQPASAPVTNPVQLPFNGPEFLRLAPRKDSEVTSGSSESGFISLAPITAIPPSSEDVLSDDEVWNEYDDLIDRVSPTIPTESPSIDETMIYATSKPTWPPMPIDYMTAPLPLNPGRRIAVPIKLAQDALGSSRIDHPSQNRGPALPASFEQSGVPSAQIAVIDNPLSSPFTLSDLYSNYGNRSSIGKPNQRLSNISATSGSRYSSQTIISESGSRSSMDSPQDKRVTQVMAEKTLHASSDSLRFSALMTSRWLSFDRVLFSPALDEVRHARQSRVLVLDGLGNDDWSTYCALTYSDATVYNLSPANRKFSARETVASANDEGWVPPPNLRRVAHSSLSAPFPFPKGFFAVVVLRFPAADTPNAYKHAISECKRVLKPGGYLELSILDVDMVNMGNQMRRAIRGVKVRMAEATPDVSLSPASDTIIKLLGRRGFENLNRCVVSVPLSTNGMMTPTRNTEKASRGGLDSYGLGVERSGHLSFQELLQAHTRLSNSTAQGESASGLDQVAVSHHRPAMMGRVAQWWWSRCYEAPIQQARSGHAHVSEPAKGEIGRDSVWMDPALIQECVDRQTGLRLVICYAQKPESVRRRTVSV